MLTSAQKATIKAAIQADSTLNAFPNNSDGAFAIAAALNTTATPDFYVWRASVDISEIMINGFDWTRVDNMTVGKSRIWEYMTQLGVINPSQDNVRAGVLAAFTAAADSGMRLSIFGHCQRLSTRVEKLFATGSGTTTNDQGVGPASSTWTMGPISYQDVEAARNS